MKLGNRVAKLAGYSGRGHPQTLLLTTSAVFVVDQASKGAARMIQLGAQNDTHPVHWWWVLLLPVFALVATLAPSRRVAIFTGLFLGGFIGNLVDQHFWPGGIPDFISFDAFYWNLADIFILAGLALLVMSPVVRLGAALFRRPRVATESSLGS